MKTFNKLHSTGCFWRTTNNYDKLLAQKCIIVLRDQVVVFSLPVCSVYIQIKNACQG